MADGRWTMDDGRWNDGWASPSASPRKKLEALPLHEIADDLGVLGAAGNMVRRAAHDMLLRGRGRTPAGLFGSTGAGEEVSQALRFIGTD
jgi:hypothetical protein